MCVRQDGKKGCEYSYLGKVYLPNKRRERTLEGCPSCGRLLGGGTVRETISGLLRQDPEATIRPNGSKEYLSLDSYSWP